MPFITNKFISMESLKRLLCILSLMTFFVSYAIGQSSPKSTNKRSQAKYIRQWLQLTINYCHQDITAVATFMFRTQNVPSYYLPILFCPDKINIDSFFAFFVAKQSWKIRNLSCHHIVLNSHDSSITFIFSSISCITELQNFFSCRKFLSTWDSDTNT